MKKICQISINLFYIIFAFILLFNGKFLSELTSF